MQLSWHFSETQTHRRLPGLLTLLLCLLSLRSESCVVVVIPSSVFPPTQSSLHYDWLFLFLQWSLFFIKRTLLPARPRLILFSIDSPYICMDTV